jgi:hypothetical protein
MSYLNAVRQALPTGWRRPWRRRTSLAEKIWSHFLAQPGFREDIRQAMRDLEAGRAVPLKEIPRER